MTPFKYFLLSLLSIVSTFASAQGPMNVQWSKWYDHESTVTPQAYFGNDSSGYYGILETYNYYANAFIKRKQQDLAFFKLDLKGEFVFTKKLSLKYKEETVRISQDHTIGGQYYLFANFQSKKEKTVTILVYTLDKKGNVSASPRELMVLPTLDEDDYAYECYQDKDSSAFYIRSSTGQNLEKGSFRLFKFDTALNLVATQDFKFPTDEFYQPDQMILHRNKIYILGLVPRDLEVKRAAKYKLSSYDLKTYQSAHESITLNTGTTASCYLDFDAQENPVLTGFYVKEMRFKWDSKLLDGFYCLKFDYATGNEIFNIQKEFPQEVMMEFTTEKKAAAGFLLSELRIKSINNRSDGSMYIVSEHAANTYSGDHIYYTYQNLIVTSISKEGTIEWFKTIPKPKQSSIMIDHVRFYSFLQGSAGDNVFFLYNENYDNPNRPKTIDHAGLINCNDVITTLATLDRKGNLTRQTVFKEDNPKHKTCIEPINSLKISEDTFILFRTSGQDAKLGLLNFKK